MQRGSGPFPEHAAEWLGAPDNLTAKQRFAAVSLYLAMMTAVCLELTGADGPVIVEGPFARNRVFGAMLGVATGREVLAATGSATGTSLGAALLAAESVAPRTDFAAFANLMPEKMTADFARWQAALG